MSPHPQLSRGAIELMVRYIVDPNAAANGSGLTTKGVLTFQQHLDNSRDLGIASNSRSRHHNHIINFSTARITGPWYHGTSGSISGTWYWARRACKRFCRSLVIAA